MMTHSVTHTVSHTTTHTMSHGVTTLNKLKETKQNKIIKKEKDKKEKSDLIEIYNSICASLPLVKKVTDKRKTAINKFLKEFSVDDFKQICLKANSSDFLTGLNERGWKADFDFMMRTDKATAILEGKYDNKKSVNHEEKQVETEEEKIARKTRELKESIANGN